MSVIPQRDRSPRLIVDFTYSGINDTTISPVPNKAMQFGHSLDRILYKIHHADSQHGLVYLIKVDLADGFYACQ